MKLSDIIKEIENTAPLAMAAEWDNSGMQVASVRTDVNHLALILDPTPGMVQKALEAGADMVLSHHPLAMKPTLPFALNDFHAVLRLLFAHDVPLYSAHTSLDANLHGPAAWLADALFLTNRTALAPIAEHPTGEPSYGFGITGVLPNPVPYAEFTDKLAAILGKSVWQAAGPMPELVKRVAYCPGSGESMIPAAACSGANVYVTGDVKYHAALEAPLRVLDVGHFILEEAMMRTFAKLLRQACAPITVTFFEASDPFTLEGSF